MKAIGIALEAYATDNVGHYPTRLAQLTPKYLESLPICPAAHKDSYSESFQSSTRPDAFICYCSGLNHADVGEGQNFPQYSNNHGLVAHGSVPRGAAPAAVRYDWTRAELTPGKSVGPLLIGEDLDDVSRREHLSHSPLTTSDSGLMVTILNPAGIAYIRDNHVVAVGAIFGHTPGGTHTESRPQDFIKEFGQPQVTELPPDPKDPVHNPRHFDAYLDKGIAFYVGNVWVQRIWIFSPNDKAAMEAPLTRLRR